MITVYRVMNEEGEGPYRGDCRVTSLDDHAASNGRPPPSEDGVPWFGFDRATHVFSFSTPDAAAAWFTRDEQVAMAEQGFHLYRVPAADVLRGRKQVAFVPAGTPVRVPWPADGGITL